MADVFRAPVIAPRRDGPARASVFDPPNILLGLLAVLPFHGYETPAPKPVAQVQRQFDPPNLLFSTLAPVVVATLPFIANVPPSPARQLAQAAAFDPPNLITTTLQAAFPVQNWQWPSPAAQPPKALAFDPPNTTGTILVTTAPFQAFLWPNPYTMPPKAASFDPPFPGQPPPAPTPDVTPQGGHWLAPTRKELDRIKREAARAKDRQESEWDQALRDREKLHEQIMATLHPEKVIGVSLPESAITPDDDDEDDIAILLLYG